eukprot:6199860-Pleurochrysis_carterae.AAC.1
MSALASGQAAAGLHVAQPQGLSDRRPRRGQIEILKSNLLRDVTHVSAQVASSARAGDPPGRRRQRGQDPPPLRRFYSQAYLDEKTNNMSNLNTLSILSLSIGDKSKPIERRHKARTYIATQPRFLT